MYKSFIRCHLDFDNILYDKDIICVFKRWNPFSIMPVLAITVAIRDISKEKLFQELGLDSVQLRRWFRKLVMSYKICKRRNAQYFFLI